MYTIAYLNSKVIDGISNDWILARELWKYYNNITECAENDTIGSPYRGDDHADIIRISWRPGTVKNEL